MYPIEYEIVERELSEMDSSLSNVQDFSPIVTGGISLYNKDIRFALYAALLDC